MVWRRSWSTAHTTAIAVAIMMGLAAFLLGRPAHGAPNADRIAVWYGDGGPDRLLDLGSTPRVVVELDDVQYAEKTRFRGFWLAPLIERARRPGLDRVLLRFANGMIVPLELDRLPKVFVAVDVWSSTRWVAPPPAYRKHNVFVDVRPIVFGWNKVVVAVEGEDFTPWRHTSTLTALEFVDSRVYLAPFDAGSSPLLVRGRDVFLERCQFCHAVAGHGASLGWDFVVPVPVSTYRSSPESLRIHVNHRVSNAAELGLLMPVPGQLSKDDATALWTWMDTLAKASRGE